MFAEVTESLLFVAFTVLLQVMVVYLGDHGSLLGALAAQVALVSFFIVCGIHARRKGWPPARFWITASAMLVCTLAVGAVSVFRYLVHHRP